MSQVAQTVEKSVVTVNPTLNGMDSPEIEWEKYDYIRLISPDFLGRSRCKTIPAARFPTLKKSGIGVLEAIVAFSPRNHLAHINDFSGFSSGNWMPCLPIYPVPWARCSQKVGEVICNPHWKNGQISEIAPRELLNRQVKQLEQLGYLFRSAIEYEFSIFEGIDGYQPLFKTPGMLSTDVLSDNEGLFYTIADHMAAAGIEMDCCHSEHCAGQFEFTFLPQFGLKTADNMFRFRQGIREICRAHGKRITFMTAPAFAEVPEEHGYNGAHLNFSVCHKATGENALYDVNRDNLTDVGRYFLGGVLSHMDALTAFSSPTVNCYRRFSSFMLSINKDWGFDNRTLSIRLVKGSEYGIRMEYRLPSAISNPYIVMASVIAAGYDGIVNKIEPPPQGETIGNSKIPSTLQDSLTSLKADTRLVELLGEKFVHWWVEEKQQCELNVMGHHDLSGKNYEELQLERDMYFNL